VLRDNYAARLARALTPTDFAAVFADPDQLSLLAPPTAAMRPVLDTRATPLVSTMDGIAEAGELVAELPDDE
jgi:DNA polymerase I